MDLGALGFSTLVNTRGIIAGTYAFYFYDEINGAAPITMASVVAAGDTSVAFGQTFTPGSLIQLDQEVLQVTGTNTDGSSAVTRGAVATVASAHTLPFFGYPLSEKRSNVAVGEKPLAAIRRSLRSGSQPAP